MASQARHEFVAPKLFCASRNVVPQERERRRPTLDFSNVRSPVVHFQHLFEEGGGDKGHVAGEEEEGVGAGAGEGGVDAAEWTAAGNGVAAEDADGKTKLRGDGADVAKDGAAAKPDAGFIAPHAGAEAAGEDANLDGDIGFSVSHGTRLKLQASNDQAPKKHQNPARSKSSQSRS